jgi:hypothetical protein
MAAGSVTVAISADRKGIRRQALSLNLSRQTDGCMGD